ncbi:hypothetical protein [Citrobacter koseri]|nr:hypothetical protein [Citrobacter koseri]
MRNKIMHKHSFYIQRNQRLVGDAQQSKLATLYTDKSFDYGELADY